MGGSSNPLCLFNILWVVGHAVCWGDWECTLHQIYTTQTQHPQPQENIHTINKAFYWTQVEVMVNNYCWILSQVDHNPETNCREEMDREAWHQAATWAERTLRVLELGLAMDSTLGAVLPWQHGCPKPLFTLSSPCLLGLTLGSLDVCFHPHKYVHNNEIIQDNCFICLNTVLWVLLWASVGSLPNHNLL